MNVHFTEINPDPDMPSRETNGFDPCVFPQENSCLPFLAMKTHAIFILENESIIRSGFPPISLTLHSSTLQTAQLQLLQIGARAPRSRLSVSASLGKGGGARRSEAGKMPHREPASPRNRSPKTRERRIKRPPDQETAGGGSGGVPRLLREKGSPECRTQDRLRTGRATSENPGNA